ncbi:Hypothetical protein PHPALM_37471 [Phytophthora palmivora]|uniref:HTH CENPB-type domain-containing protein n=1 Tax=Phytophthora palmivora TaxID=4796 RepID=A0A2P4WXE1_9STRA|nr:Hypothetical protein PHPALM_37471 [Phytophthora palmivora]
MKVSQSVKKRYSDAGGGFRDKRQRGGFSKNVPFEDELYQWICSVRARKMPLLVSHVQQKAKLLATRHKMNEDFKASNGWYYRFCNRYGLTPASFHAGASTSLNVGVETQKSVEKTEMPQEWRKLREQVQQYAPEFVYTMSEVRLFYQMLPRALEVVEQLGTMTTTQKATEMIADAVGGMERNETPGKLARVLVLICVNGTGTHKIPLLVLGKEKVPACLTALHPPSDMNTEIYNGIGLETSYCSRREIWYKIGLFQERLDFIETSDEEKYRLMQRAAKKSLGSAGVTLGRVPHLLDAMSLLDEAWTAIPTALIRDCWIKSSLGSNSVLSSPAPMITREQSDDAVVMEFCSMLRGVALVDDMDKLAKDVHHWLYIDDDSSEQMQQELLYDIQQLLQEEELQQHQQGNDKTLSQHPHQQHQMEFQLQQQQNAVTFMDTSDLPTPFGTSQPYVYRTTDGRAAPIPSADSVVVLAEKHKSIDFALQALAGAEEALDNADVTDFFGDEAAGQAIENISRELRKLRRIQRGKQSALVAAAVNAAASGDVNDSSSGALFTHEYFYGNCARGRNS